MKKLFVILMAGIVFFTSCSSDKKEEKPKTSTDQYFDQQMDEITDQKVAIKNEYKLRMERKKLQTMWESYSDCDAAAEPKKKTEDGEDCSNCGPQQIVIIDNSNCNKTSSTKKWGGIKKPKPPCPPCPPKVGPVKPPCSTCGTDKTVYVNGEEYKEYHGEEAPASAPGVAKPGYYFNPLDSMWYKKN